MGRQTVMYRQSSLYCFGGQKEAIVGNDVQMHYTTKNDVLFLHLSRYVNIKVSNESDCTCMPNWS